MVLLNNISSLLFLRALCTKFPLLRVQRFLLGTVRVMHNSSALSLVDIGANLTDPMYQGRYHGKPAHPPDLDKVLQRSFCAGVSKILVTGGSLEESIQAQNICHHYNQGDEPSRGDSIKQIPELYSTVGCHPTRCREFENSGNPDRYLNELTALARGDRSGTVVAVGEIGLDYDRLHFCPKHVQLKYFERQLQFAQATNLPLFLHMRNCGDDLINILRRHPDCLQRGGVVHSFTGTVQEARQIMELGLYLGINGCSLKTEENLSVVREIPLDCLLLETDAPWCDIKQTHASWQYVRTHSDSRRKEKWSPETQVKGRNEPCNIVQVLEVVSALKSQELSHVCKTVFDNTMKLFFPLQVQSR